MVFSKFTPLRFFVYNIFRFLFFIYFLNHARRGVISWNRLLRRRSHHFYVHLDSCSDSFYSTTVFIPLDSYMKSCNTYPAVLRNPLFAEFFFLSHKKDRKKKTGAHRPLPREKFVFIFLVFYLYNKISKCATFFRLDVPKESRIVSGESASNRLKIRVKKWPVHRVRSHAIYHTRGNGERDE